MAEDAQPPAGKTPNSQATNAAGGPPPIPMQSRVNELAAKNTASRPQSAPPNLKAPPGMPGWAIALIVCAGVTVPIICILAALLLPALSKAKAKAERINCASNLKIIGLGFRLWEGDHDDEFQFNVSTNKGGTLELCAVGEDGFDKNSWLHFQVMSNELANPKYLVCPADTTKHAAADFSHLQAFNVTYLARSGTNISDANPQTALAICPIHHTVLLADGSVQTVSDAQWQKLLH